MLGVNLGFTNMLYCVGNIEFGIKHYIKAEKQNIFSSSITVGIEYYFKQQK